MMPIYKSHANLQIVKRCIRCISNSRDWHKIRIALASRKGFTLLEMVVATGIFSVIMIIAVGTLISVEDAQRKAHALQNVQDNLRYTLESMTKEIRAGTNFMSNGLVGRGLLTFQVANQASFTTYTYCLTGRAISKFTSNSGTAPCDQVNSSAVTDPNVSIDYLTFSVNGNAQAGDDGQPRVTVVVRAHSGSGRSFSNYQLQTTVTARNRDLMH